MRRSRSFAAVAELEERVDFTERVLCSTGRGQIRGEGTGHDSERSTPPPSARPESVLDGGRSQWFC